MKDKSKKKYKFKRFNKKQKFIPRDYIKEGYSPFEYLSLKLSKDVVKTSVMKNIYLESSTEKRLHFINLTPIEKSCKLTNFNLTGTIFPYINGYNAGWTINNYQILILKNPNQSSLSQITELETKININFTPEPDAVTKPSNLTEELGQSSKKYAKFLSTQEEQMEQVNDNTINETLVDLPLKSVITQNTDGYTVYETGSMYPNTKYIAMEVTGTVYFSNISSTAYKDDKINKSSPRELEMNPGDKLMMVISSNTKFGINALFYCDMVYN